MKTDIDKNLSLEAVEGNTSEVSGAILKSDSIRLIARRDIKITVNGKNYIALKEDGSIVIEGGDIKLGKNATERIIRGDSFKNLFMTHTHATSVGTSSTPIQQFVDDVHLSRRKVLVD